MNKFVELAKVLENRELRPGLFRMTVRTDNIARMAAPGQFVHIKIEDGLYLRRPISIFNTEDNDLTFIYEVRGKGTKALSTYVENQKLDIMGPLGNGYTADKKFKKVALVGGGIGIFPLYMLAKYYGNTSVSILGFRSKDQVVTQDEFKSTGSEVLIATDDGSFGYHGFVTDVLKEEISKGGIDAVLACGPLPMLKGVSAICSDYGIFCEVSMEERMACGIGVCLGCAVRGKVADHEDYLHVCKNGPVFNAKEVF